MAEIEFDERSKKLNLKWVLFFFLIVIIFLAYGAFKNNLIFTGNFIKEEQIKNSIKINANLGVSEMDFKGNYGSLIINNPKESAVYIGNSKFELENNLENSLVIENFDGRINFDSLKILALDGKSSKIIINKVQILPDSGSSIKIRIESPTSYSSLSIQDNFFIDKLDYTTSGIIELKKTNNILTVNNEEIVIRNFYGNMSSSGGKFNIFGEVSELLIKGNETISIKAE